MLTLAICAAAYLLVGVLCCLWAWSEGNRVRMAPWWVCVLLLPIAVFSLPVNNLLRLWGTSWYRRVPAYRVFNLIRTCRKRCNRYRLQIDAGHREVARWEKMYRDEVANHEKAAVGKANRLLNSKWLVATAAAREALAAELKVPLPGGDEG